MGDENSLHLKVVYDENRESSPCVLFFSGADCHHESYMWLASRLVSAGCAVALSTCVVPFGPTTCLLSMPFDLGALASLEEYKKNPSREGIAARYIAGPELSIPRRMRNCGKRVGCKP